MATNGSSADVKAPPKANYQGVGNGVSRPTANFEGVLKGPGFMAYNRAIQAHFLKQGDDLNAMANYLKQGIIKSSKWPFAVNKRLAAHRVSRPYFRASELCYDLAACTVVGRRIYAAQFTKQETTKRDAFDPTGAK